MEMVMSPRIVTVTCLEDPHAQPAQGRSGGLNDRLVGLNRTIAMCDLKRSGKFYRFFHSSPDQSKRSDLGSFGWRHNVRIQRKSHKPKIGPVALARIARHQPTLLAEHHRLAREQRHDSGSRWGRSRSVLTRRASEGIGCASGACTGRCPSLARSYQPASRPSCARLMC